MLAAESKLRPKLPAGFEYVLEKQRGLVRVTDGHAVYLIVMEPPVRLVKITRQGNETSCDFKNPVLISG